MPGVPTGFVCQGEHPGNDSDAELLRRVLAAVSSKEEQAEQEHGRQVLERHYLITSNSVREGFARRGMIAPHYARAENYLEHARIRVREEIYLRWHTRGRSTEPSVEPHTRHIARTFDHINHTCVGPLLSVDYAFKTLGWLDRLAIRGEWAVPCFTHADEIRMWAEEGAWPDDPPGGTPAGPCIDRLLDGAPNRATQAGLIVLAAPYYEVPDERVPDDVWGYPISSRETFLAAIALLRENRKLLNETIGNCDREMAEIQYTIKAFSWQLKRPDVRLREDRDRGDEWQQRKDRAERLQQEVLDELERLRAEHKRLNLERNVTDEELARILKTDLEEAWEIIRKVREWLSEELDG